MPQDWRERLRPWATDGGLRAFHALAALITLGGLAIILWSLLADLPFWFDEAYSVRAAMEPLPDILRRWVLLDPHPPLYHYLLWAWAGVFGTGEIAVRSLSTLAVLGAIALLWRRGQAQFPPVALAFATFWLASHALAIFYAQEARVYSLNLLAGTWLSLVLGRLWNLEEPLPWQEWAKFGALAVLCSLLHYFMTALVGVALLLLLFRHRRNTQAALALAAAGALCLLWPLCYALAVTPPRILGQDGMGWGGGLGAVLWGLLQLLWPPIHLHVWEPGALLRSLYAAALLAILALGAHALQLLWRAGPKGVCWEGGEKRALQPQLLLLAGTLLVVVAGMATSSFPLLKALMVLLPSLALCLGMAAHLLWRGRYWPLCAVALLIGSSWLHFASLTAQRQWAGWTQGFRGHALVRDGAAEVVAAMAADPDTRLVYTLMHDLPHAARRREAETLAHYLRPGPHARPITLVWEGDLRHLIPPYRAILNVGGDTERLRRGLGAGEERGGVLFVPR